MLDKLPDSENYRKKKKPDKVSFMRQKLALLKSVKPFGPELLGMESRLSQLTVEVVSKKVARLKLEVLRSSMKLEHEERVARLTAATEDLDVRVKQGRAHKKPHKQLNRIHAPFHLSDINLKGQAASKYSEELDAAVDTAVSAYTAPSASGPATSKPYALTAYSRIFNSCNILYIREINF